MEAKDKPEADLLEICGDHYLKGIRRSDCIDPEEAKAAADEQILSHEERMEVMTLVQEKNISMDFILEMKEAFLLFDKVRLPYSHCDQLIIFFRVFFYIFSAACLQNGDGYISARELGVLMRTLGRNPTEEEILNIMNEIDVDHNGKLDFSEFVIMMRDKLSGEDMEQEIRQAFR